MKMLRAETFDVFLAALTRRGYTVVGPRVVDGAIGYGELGSSADLPRGLGDRQDGGRYRLEPRPDGAWFGYTVGPHSLKRYLFPSRRRLWRAERAAGGSMDFSSGDSGAPPRYAFVGVRPCELAALAVHDRVLAGGAFADPSFRALREGALLVAVQCGTAGGTCFCASLGTGPRAGSGFDLALTELVGDGRHDFAVEVGSERGAEIAAELPLTEPTPDDERAADDVTAHAEATMGRALAPADPAQLAALLAARLEHPRWQHTADRCLTCGNCTLVCPTCFCWTVEDTASLDGRTAERFRRWDSCFTTDFSYLHGGAVRASARARYRQWLTHKLGAWSAQFGTLGCVGCGRCITWCPVAIDLTEEVRHLASESA